MIWSARFKSLRLLHADLLKSAIEIGMGDVHGVKFKVLQGCQGRGQGKWWSDLQESSGANCTLPRRQFDDLPSAIDTVSFHLFLTYIVPQICIRVMLGLLASGWLNCGCNTNLNEVKMVIRI